MANSGWTVDPNSITLPPGAGSNDPRIFIGPDDPIASLTSDAAIVFYWADGRAFLITVGSSGAGDVGELTFAAYDEINGFAQLIDLERVVSAGTSTVYLGVTADVNIQGDTEIEDTKSFHDQLGMRYMKGQQGQILFTFVTLSQSTSAVVFPVAFPAGQVPKVTINIDSGAGATAGWVARAFAVTETGFTAFVFNTRSDPAAAVFTPLLASWTNIPVSWTATIPG